MLSRCTYMILVSCIFSMITIGVSAAEQDSTIFIKSQIRTTQSPFSVKQSFAQHFSYHSLGFVATGLMLKSQKNNFRTMRNTFVPNYKSSWDNYTQYAPLAATWGLKMVGIEGQSSWLRLAVSNALSAAIMTGIVNSVKYTVREQRPDGSARNSFPSGHTATAFMAATVLHKEYGLTQSPWFSIAGYSVASATAVGRILNNRHWISDVLVGAGIGIISTDLGYFLADVILKNKGLQRVDRPCTETCFTQRPSFFALNVGRGISKGNITTPQVVAERVQYLPTSSAQKYVQTPLNVNLKFGNTASVSAEGAYFFNSYIGAGAQLRATTVGVNTAIPFDIVHSYTFNVANTVNGTLPQRVEMHGVEANTLGIIDMCGGVYFSYPLCKQFCLGGKIMIGSGVMTDISIDALTLNNTPKEHQATGNIQHLPSKQYNPTDISRSKLMCIQFENTPVYATGLSLSWAYRKGLSIKGYIDYDYAAPKLSYHISDNVLQHQINGLQTERLSLHNLNVGIGMKLHI